MEKSITAPLALIKMNDGQGNFVTVGKMRNIRVTESIRRLDVKGIGQLYPVERPVIDWSGTLTCSSFVVNLHRAGITGSPNRLTNDPQKFANTLLMNEQGVQIYLYKKVKNEVNPTTGIVESILEEPITVIKDAYIERESFDIVEGQVMGKDQDFSYLTPVLIDPANAVSTPDSNPAG
ncbi:hypothetical protein EOM86_09500 [Candidatus Nomurabacteria bacterium]|nr:hypothetical protein [Candidatus Nomurabacteria bacterium]